MTEDQLELLIKAQESLEASKVLLAEGFPDFAASRAYYTMFHVAQAFLEGEGMSFSKHSAVIAAFGQHFANSGRVPVDFHQSRRGKGLMPTQDIVDNRRERRKSGLFRRASDLCLRREIL